MATEIKKIISRRDTAAKWEANNPILSQGEIGVDTTNKVMKIGDGVTPWKSLTGAGGVEIVNDLTTGGADKALSAEMGKELSKKLINVQGSLADDMEVEFSIAGMYYSLSGKLMKPDNTSNTKAAATPMIPIKGYIRVEVITTIGSTGAAIIFYDAGGDIMQVVPGDNSGNQMADVPKDAYFAAFSNYSAEYPIARLYADDTIAVKVAKAVSEDTIVSSVNPLGNQFNVADITIGYEVYDNGNLSKQSASAASDYINVEGKTTLYFNNLPIYEGIARRVAFYDADKVFIAIRSISQTLSSAELIIPTGASYCRFSLYQRAKSLTDLNYSNIMLTFDGFKDFEPYSEILVGIGGYNIPIPTPTFKVKLNKKAVIFGDSITETASISDDGSSYTEGTRINWPKFAMSLLGISYFRNYAKSGATYKKMTDSAYRQDVSEQISMAMADTNNDDADIIVISLGTNDGDTRIGTYEAAMSKSTLDELDRNYLYEAVRWAFWSIAQKYEGAKLFVGMPIQRASGEQPDTMLNAIKEMARRYNFTIIDATNESGIVRDFETKSAEGRYLSDGLHPNTEGSKKLGVFYANKIGSEFLYTQ